jgi:phosphoribosylaminoimidazole-succinocarboxamide synthase
VKPYSVGKVRETYYRPDDDSRLLVVATDRVSAFDHVFGNGVIDKGRLLTAITALAFEELSKRFETHYLGVPRDLEVPFLGRTLEVRKLRMVPVECVVRGYLVGSAWEAYRNSGSVNGVPLAPGLDFGQRLPEPMFTPTTKAATGHDIALSDEELTAEVGDQLAQKLRDTSIEIYAELASWFESRGLTLVDTKFEFGLSGENLVLADEVATPDSSRIVIGALIPGGDNPGSWLDKQVLRDWLLAKGYRGDGDPPELEQSVLDELTKRYRTVYEMLSGDNFAAWPGSSEIYMGRGSIED